MNTQSSFIPLHVGCTVLNLKNGKTAKVIAMTGSAISTKKIFLTILVDGETSIGCVVKAQPTSLGVYLRDKDNTPLFSVKERAVNNVNTQK